MKNKLRSLPFVLFVLFVQMVIAQTNGNAIINVYRPWKFSLALYNASILINGEEIGKLSNNSKLSYKVPKPGKYKISFSMWSRLDFQNENTAKEVEVNQGDVVYFEINLDQPFAKKQLKQINQAQGKIGFDEISNDKLVVVGGNNNELAQNQDKGKQPPRIVITYPNISRGFKSVEQNSQIMIQGNVTDESGIAEVLINNEHVQLSASGDFTKSVVLNQGDNSFLVKATDKNNNTSFETFTVQRQDNSMIGQYNTPANQTIKSVGKYYALIIGNNNYQDQAIATLNEPINDAGKLYSVLTTNYSFEPQNVILLKNATYVQMIDAFDDLNHKITSDDNLIVFYAGHGWWDEAKSLGYWLPVDAKKNSTAFWIPNSRISDYMSGIKSKHTLLIADACFSGSIFKTRSAFADAQPAYNKLYELTSKKAMTSGNLKEVPDKSVFLQYLIKRLTENTEKYISSDMLFASFRQAVLNNSPSEPQYGTIQNAGDEGGEFIFIHK